MLIKLDDGSFINMELITGIYPLIKPQRGTTYAVTMNARHGLVYITSADCDRIVAVMGVEVTDHD